MPGSRSLPFNERKRSTLSCVGDAKLSISVAADRLRRPSKDISDEDIEDLLVRLGRAQERLAQAESFARGMKGLRRS